MHCATFNEYCFSGGPKLTECCCEKKMLLDFLPLFLLMQGFCRAEIARSVDTSLPATSIGLYLKSLVRRELSFEHLQDLSNALGKTKDAEKPKDVNEIIADTAKKLDFKMTLLQDFLTNMTNKLSASCFHTQNLSKETKLPQPCCSNNPDMIYSQSCSVIHLGFNGTRIAKLAADVFHSSKTIQGVVRSFFMTKDRTTHLEFPAAQACGQQGE